MPNFARISYNLLMALRRLKWNKKEMQDYQNKRLRKVVHYAYGNAPFYRRLFKEVGISPSDVKCVEDLSKLPIIRKADMRKRPCTDLISRDFNIGDLKALETGGSTGEPFTIYISRKEDDWRKAIYLRANVSCGQKVRDKWVAVLNAERSVDTTSLQHLLRIFAQNVVPVVWSKAAQLGAIKRFKPDVLDGFSSALWLLAREIELKDLRPIRPRMIFGSGELIPQSSREYLEKVFCAPYYDQFGCTEIDRSAWQCPERMSYHMDVDSVIMQFVDEKGEDVGNGKRGEIVYTSLFNYAMPFIRYGTQDIGIPIDDECVCGRKLPLMTVVEGRNNSFLMFPDGHIVAPMTFIEILKAFRLVKEIEQYRVVQKRADLVEICIKKVDESVDEERIRRWLIANVLEDLPKVADVDLSGVRFEVTYVDSLPVTRRGKLNVVVSNVSTSKWSNRAR